MATGLKCFNLVLILLILSCCSSCDPKDDGGGDMTPTSVRVSVQDIAIVEREVDHNNFIRLSLSAASQELITVYISSEDVTATEGEDYTGFNNVPVVFEPGDVNKDYQFSIKGDADFEQDETFEVVINNIEGNATIADGTGVVTINNDDENVTAVVIPTSGYSTPETYPDMNLIWRDEFAGSEVNLNDWTFEIGRGNSGWGNNELQYYQKENTSIIDGYLVIEAKENQTGNQYTSSRMITKDKFDFQYGRVDIRAALPTGQGVWPALWMLGSRISTVGWPSCGEIDIMEIVGHKPDELHGTAHWSNAGGDHTFIGGSTTRSAGSLKNEFHVYSIIWNDTQIRWFLDDQQYYVLNTTPAAMTEFRNGNFFFIFNVAVGGNWPGSPDATTVFPQRMIVDYIRVFQ